MSEKRSRTPLVFLPGAGGIQSAWRPVAGELADLGPFQCMGWPGFDGLPPDLGIGSMRDLYEWLVARLPPGASHIIAQSMGGVLAVRLALERPERVAKLVLAASSGGIDVARLGASDWRPEYRAELTDVPAWFLDDRTDFTDRLGEIRAETLLLSSDSDPVSPLAVSEFLARRIPNARVATIIGGSHMFVNERAKEVARLIRSHLEGRADTRSPGEEGTGASFGNEPVRPDLAALRDRVATTLDPARPDAVARRRKKGQRTARENIDQLLDPGSFIEYGGLALAAQRQRLSEEELIKASPADGLIGGIGTVNGAMFDDERARTLVLAYDYSVFAGTQGGMSHKKLDRLLALAGEWRLPIVLFAEGGGGRPNDTDLPWIAGLDTPSFLGLAALSGVAPRVGVVSGRCFAGNAALLGCCDVIIATEDSNIGMGGPAMIQGGGLGTFTPEEIGPTSVQSKNGVIDVRVKGEIEAVEVAKKYLGYFQGKLSTWTMDHQRKLRDAVPERRRRAYRVQPIIEILADTGSVLELRREFGVGIVTALLRLEGRPLGLIANNPYHLGGAIDADAADKAARFMQLCDAFDLPIVSLCDTPGFMVGPKAEETALVRHVSRMFVTAASLTVPFFTVVLRKGYGLGAQAMAGGHFHAPFFTIAWPGGEFGGMGIEGAVRLGMRKQLEAVQDPKEREQMFEAAVAHAYERGRAINMASVLEIDGVIDPADTRSWLLRGLKSVPKTRAGDRKRRFIDTW